MTIEEIIIDAKIDELTYQVQENLNDSDLLELNNEVCDAHNYNDDIIYSNDQDFFDTFYGTDIMQALEDADNDEYSVRHEYVKCTIWGLKSSDCVNDLIDIDNDIIIDYLYEHEDYLRNCAYSYGIDWDDVDYEVDKAIWEALDDICQDEGLDTDDLVEYAKENECEEIEDLIEMYKEEHQEWYLLFSVWLAR